MLKKVISRTMEMKLQCKADIAQKQNNKRIVAFLYDVNICGNGCQLQLIVQ